jgi:hypothetical protein
MWELKVVQRSVSKLKKKNKFAAIVDRFMITRLFPLINDLPGFARRLTGIEVIASNV